MATVNGMCDKRIESTLVQITALGDIGSGKSTILKRIWQGGLEPLSDKNPFELRDSVHKCVPIPIEGKQVWMDVQLYDSSGMESNGLLTSSFYRKKDGVILVWDCLENRSLENLVKWEEDLRHYYLDSEYPAIVLFANNYEKSTLNERMYSDCVARYVTRNIVCFKVNPVSGEGVREGFDQLLKLIGNKLTQSFSSLQKKRNGMTESIQLNQPIVVSDKDTSCCS